MNKTLLLALAVATMAMGTPTSAAPPTKKSRVDASDAKSTKPQEAKARPAEEPANRPPMPASIDRNGVMILVRRTLLSVQDANETGNFTVLRDLAAPGFRRRNNAIRLGEIFAGLRERGIDLSGVAALEPQLSLLPQVESNGHLHLAGAFPSVPSQVTFDLDFAPVEGHWRPDTISIGLAPTQPAAPPAPPVVDEPEAGGAAKAPSTNVIPSARPEPTAKR